MQMIPLLIRLKEESDKAGLKLNIKKTKIMAFSPIPSWQREGEKVEAVTDFPFLVSRITVDGDCSHELIRYLFLGMTKLWKSYGKARQHVKKQRHLFA